MGTLRPEGREAVYRMIDSERDYQDAMTASADRPDMIEELGISGGLLAMEHCLEQARTAWYSGSGGHPEAMIYVRKIAGLAVRLGEELGMARRTWPVDVILPDGTEEMISATGFIPHGGHSDDAYQIIATDGRVFRQSQVAAR